MRRVVPLLVAGFVLAACSGGGGSGGSDPGPSTTGAVPDTKPAIVAWGQLRNPILSYTDASITDFVVRRVKGQWSVMFSDLQDSPRASTVGRATSDELRIWDDRILDGPGWPYLLPAADGSLVNVSPDVIRTDGHWLATYQAPVDGQTKLFYRTSKDLVHYTEAMPLGRELYPLSTDAMSDAALADTGRGLILGFHHNGEFEVALGGSLDGPWRLLGPPDTGPLQHEQFTFIDGHWYLIGETLPDGHPSLFELSGDPQDPTSWVYWTKVGELNVPQEAWNGGQRPTAPYLYDARRYDGYFYLFFTGTVPADPLGAPGRTMIGVARSQDLETWEVPPG